MNLKLIVQLAPTPKLLPQVLVWKKSPALVPEITTCDRFSVTLPLLVKITICGADGLIAEAQSGGLKAYHSANTGETGHLRTARRVIVDTDRGRSGSRGSGPEAHVDRATS